MKDECYLNNKGGLIGPAFVVFKSLTENLHRTFQSVCQAPGVRNGGECGIALTTTPNLRVIIRCFHADFQDVLSALYIVCNVEPEWFPDAFSNSLAIDVDFGGVTDFSQVENVSFDSLFQ